MSFVLKARSQILITLTCIQHDLLSMLLEVLLCRNRSLPLQRTVYSDRSILKSQKVDTSQQLTHLFSHIIQINLSFDHSVHVDVAWDWVRVIHVLSDEVKDYFELLWDYVVSCDDQLYAFIRRADIWLCFWRDDSLAVGSNSTCFAVYFFLAGCENW